jgi:TatA/E family protein of Tat protein translocase
MGPIGVPELIIIFVVALIVFGPRKLPELGKSLGKGLAEFRRASNELRSTIEEEVRALEAEPPASTPSTETRSEPVCEEVRTIEPEAPAASPNTESESRSSSRSSSEANVDAH